MGNGRVFAELIINAQETCIPYKTIDMNKNKSNSCVVSISRTTEIKIIKNKTDRKWTHYLETVNLNQYKKI